MDALIGATGFVGSSLLRQAAFGARFDSSTVGESAAGSFGLAVCAGAPAQKWIANREPAADRANIEKLIGHLDRLRCDRLVLVSTVDVFARPVAVDEGAEVPEQGLHPYGLHRRLLERFVAGRFREHLIVRLPGLVGPGLRKNAVYDLHHDHDLGQIDVRGVFQFYPMVNLWADIGTALAAGLRLVHLTAEPIAIAEVAAQVFGKALTAEGSVAPPEYDLRSRHAALFGGTGSYQYSRRESLLALRAYAQSEPRERHRASETGGRR